MNIQPANKEKGLHYDQFSPLTPWNDAESMTAWVIEYDNMDYLKTNYSTGKCTNSNATLNTAAKPPVVSCK